MFHVKHFGTIAQGRRQQSGPAPRQPLALCPPLNLRCAASEATRQNRRVRLDARLASKASPRTGQAERWAAAGSVAGAGPERARC